jgi:predicted 3-demethylubiquinone-9 3-methyltransferase (glyoxalase superfamily)
MPSVQRIAPCLWFDDQAEAAVGLYTAVFPNSRVLAVTRYGEAGKEIHGRAPGTVMTVAFELDGQEFTALNGGPVFRFTEAVSFQVQCDSQAEIDHYWAKLGDGGDPQARQCGWLKDKFGVSWQVVPRELPDLLTGDPARSQRVMTALLKMEKLDLDQLRRAAGGGAS